MRSTSSRPAAIGLTIGSLALLAGCQASDVAATVEDDVQDEVATTESAEVAEVPEVEQEEIAVGPLADGTYSATGGYRSPNGSESIGVTVTIVDGVITDVFVDAFATQGTSNRYQSQFASGIAEQVVDKPLADVQVSRVAGSSLTAGGFNQALDEIRALAQAADSSATTSSN
jgi:major membrane immunogen (membrane-anchored lipoprotein)